MPAEAGPAVTPPLPQHLHGRYLRHPFTGQLLPVVTDPTVEPARGTGTGTSTETGLGPVVGGGVGYWDH